MWHTSARTERFDSAATPEILYSALALCLAWLGVPSSHSFSRVSLVLLQQRQAATHTQRERETGESEESKSDPKKVAEERECV